MKSAIINYWLTSEPGWKKIEMNIDTFFGEQQEGLSIDSVEKHFLEPRNYVNEDRALILLLQFYLEHDGGRKTVTKFTYWDNGLSQIQDHNEYRDDKLEYRTIINSIQLEGEKQLMLRLEEVGGQLIPLTQLTLDSDAPTIGKIDLSMFVAYRNVNY